MSLSPGGSNVIETTDQEVVQCEFIGLMQDRSFMGGFTDESSRNDFRSRAAQVGATHVVYKTSSSGTILGVRAYKCLGVDKFGVVERREVGQPPVYDSPSSSSPSPVPDYSGYRRY